MIRYLLLLLLWPTAALSESSESQILDQSKVVLVESELVLKQANTKLEKVQDAAGPLELKK